MALKPLVPCTLIMRDGHLCLVLGGFWAGTALGQAGPKPTSALGHTALGAITAAHCQKGRQEEMVSFHISAHNEHRKG